MNIFHGVDGTPLTYHRSGPGDPLVCLPGGPMLPSAYLDDLGGLSADRGLVRLDLRGSGGSGVPADKTTYRCDRQVDDVEALRVALGLDRLDLLAHCAGAAVAVLHAARHPTRVDRLVLVNPSPRVVGLEITDADRREVAEQRRAETWFPAAFAAFERIWSGQATGEDWAAIEPFRHGRWDADTAARMAEEDGQRNDEAAAAYYGDGLPAPAEVRAALADLPARVLVVTGEYDVSLPPGSAAAYAGLFARAEVAVQPRGGHWPWRDYPEWFGRTVRGFLN